MNTFCDACEEQDGGWECCPNALPIEGIPEHKRRLLADRDALKLKLIDTALANGVTWASIARTLQLKDKREAKRLHKALQRTVKSRS